MNREFALAALAKVKTKFAVTNASYQRVYLPDQRPMIPSDETLRRAFFPYVVLYPTRRYASDVRRLSDDSSTIAWRLDTMCVGRTFSEVAYAEEKVREALEGERLALGSQSSTPIHYESSVPVALDPDMDDFYTSSIMWTTVSTVAQAA